MPHLEPPEDAKDSMGTDLQLDAFGTLYHGEWNNGAAKTLLGNNTHL
jgi:hypothetical protein